MVLGEKTADLLHIPRFRLKAESKSCIACGRCSKQCPMSLEVQSMVKTNLMAHTECIQCLNRVDVCPKHIIHSGIYTK